DLRSSEIVSLTPAASERPQPKTRSVLLGGGTRTLPEQRRERHCVPEAAIRIASCIPLGATRRPCVPRPRVEPQSAQGLEINAFVMPLPALFLALGRERLGWHTAAVTGPARAAGGGPHRLPGRRSGP